MTFDLSSLSADCIVRASARLPPAHLQEGRRSVDIRDSRIGQIRITFKSVRDPGAEPSLAGYWQVEHAERI